MTVALTTGLIVFDADGNDVVVAPDQIDELLSPLDNLRGATVSACPDCRSQVVACLALAEVLTAVVNPLADELSELAEEAPTLHLYIFDAGTKCRHRSWHDPGFEEWTEAVEDHLASQRCIS